MKHNGNLKVAGRLSSKRIVVGEFSGTTVSSGSYELPYPIGDIGTIVSVSADVSGNKKLIFNVLDANNMSYTPSISANWGVTPPNIVSTALDALAAMTYKIENLSTNELDITYILQPDGVGGVVWKASGDINLTNYYTKTQVNAISGTLQTEIDALSTEIVSLSAGLGAKTFTSLTDAPSSYVGKATEFVTVNSSETGLEFVSLLSGTVSCNMADQAYVITNSKLTSNSLPIVSLTLPTSGETQYLASPTNMRSGAFDVVLSGIPNVPGYKINWFSFNNV